MPTVPTVGTTPSPLSSVPPSPEVAPAPAVVSRSSTVALSPESLQPNFTLGSQTWVTPSQFFSSLESMQSVSPSQRQRMGMQSPSSRHWNSSVWQPPGGRVAGGRQCLAHCLRPEELGTRRVWGAGAGPATRQQWGHPGVREGYVGTQRGAEAAGFPTGEQGAVPRVLQAQRQQSRCRGTSFPTSPFPRYSLERGSPACIHQSRDTGPQQANSKGAAQPHRGPGGSPWLVQLA